MANIVNGILKDVLSIIFPNLCPGCRNSMAFGENFICTNCLLNLPIQDLGSNNPLEKTLLGRVRFESCFTLLKYSKGGIVQNILHNLKYSNRPDLAYKLGQLFAARIKKNNIELQCDLIIPIPLHRSKLRTRGYNQSAEFGKGIESSLNIPLRVDILQRTKKGTSQTKKGRIERLKSVTDLYDIKNEKFIVGKSILLVDDVFTTGATLETAANLILKYEPNHVSIVTIAQA